MMKTLIFWLLFVAVAYGQQSSGFTLNTGLPPGKLYLDSTKSGIVYIDTLGEKQSAGTFWQYKAKTTDTTGNPGSGYMLWDRTVQINADSLVFSHLTTDNLDVDIFLSQLSSGNHLLIQDANGSNNYQMWQVSGVPKNYNFGTATSYWKVRVVLDSSAGTGTTNFANNHQLFVVRFAGGGTSGTVTSVAISGTNGLNVISGSPITTSGTIALGITNKSIADSSIHDTTITYNKLQHNSLVDYLLGATTAYHDVQPIKLGANLSMSNDTLKATNSGGTVTTFSATGNNGISTSVANPTTTPALTIGITNGSIGDSSLHSTFLKTAVTSVAATATNGLAVSGSPITTTGTLAFSINNLSLADSSIHDTTITYGKLQHNSLANYLLGATTAYHDVQPIKLGSKLAMSNDTVNVTGTFSGTTTTSTIDLSSPSAWKTKDTTTGNILIAATTKPGSPQFTYVVQAADISSNTGVLGYQVCVSISGKNNDVSPRTLNWIATKNSTEFAASNNVSVTNADFYALLIQWGAVDVVAGDTLGIKFWGSVTNQLDYRHATFYIFPRRIAPASGQFMNFIFNPSNTGNLMSGAYSGAIGGITYTAAVPINPNMIDSAMWLSASDVAAIMGNTLSTSVTTPFVVGYGQYLTNTITTTVSLGNTNAAASSGGFTSETLFSFSTPGSSSGRMKIIRVWTIGAH